MNDDVSQEKEKSSMDKKLLIVDKSVPNGIETNADHELYDDIQTKEKSSIGKQLLLAGKISSSDIEIIVDRQKRDGTLFGEAAKSLGLIKEDDIQCILSKQFNFPFLGSGNKVFSEDLIAAFQPFCAQMDTIRAIREQLLLHWFTDHHNSLAIVSPNHNEGRTYISANLAIAFSQLGKRTLLIDADLRQPRQHILFNLPSSFGLADLLAGRTDFGIIKKISGFQDLSLLAAGTVPPNPVELISYGFKVCLEKTIPQFDVILVDTPPATKGVESRTISSICGGAILVARQHFTELDKLQFLKSELQNTGTQCLSAILGKF